MAEVIADFSAEVYGEHMSVAEPVEARIVSNRTEVVVATPEWEIRIEHAAVYDFVEKTPEIDATFVDPVLTIAYEEAEELRTIFVGAPTETISRFRCVLTRSIVARETVRVLHPERVGGRVTDATASKARISITRETVRLRRADDAVEVRLANVTEFERKLHAFGDDEPWPTVRIRHVAEGTSKTTLIGCRDKRVLAILGRYLRIEYERLREDLEEIDLSSRDIEALLTLYSGGGTAALSDALKISDDTARTVVDGLTENGLVSRDGNDVTLTDLGRIVINEQLATVNV